MQRFTRTIVTTLWPRNERDPKRQMHIGLAGWQREAASGDHRTFLRIFEHADRLGFDSVWFNELHFRRVGLPYPSPLLLAAAVFARTERIRVGLSVVVLPIHHPLLLAEQLAQLDGQSDGRLDVGIGQGVNEPLSRAFPMDAHEKHGRFAEAFQLLIRAWTEPTVSSSGPFWPCDRVEVGPPPAQRPHPPVYVAGSSFETIRFAAGRSLPLLLSLEPPEARQLAVYRQVIRDLGMHYDAARFSLARYVCIAPKRDEAEALADRLRGILHHRRQRFAAERGEDPRRLAERSLRDFVAEQAIVGDPKECIEQIIEVSRDPGVGRLRCVFNGNGALSTEDTLRAMELFAREVLPACRAVRPAEIPECPT